MVKTNKCERSILRAAGNESSGDQSCGLVKFGFDGTEAAGCYDWFLRRDCRGILTKCMQAELIFYVLKMLASRGFVGRVGCEP